MATKKRTTKPASRKASKKITASRSSKGRSSVAKGRKFEDDVAELYRLLGAQVVQNIEIHQKKVDILATFRIPGSVREHSVIVECKDEKRAVDANQRVMAFKGLLDMARGSGIADSAEIVTRVPWSDQAKGFAKTSGVELFTYTEKISQLIDLTGYMKGLVDKFDNGDPGRPSDPPLGSYYVDLSAQKGVGERAERIPVIDSYIHQWLSDETANHQLAIFGEYGSGKSTLCQKLAHDLALAHLNEPSSSRIPILLNLREFIGKLDLEAYITSFLDRECKVVNPKIELFRAMNAAGIFLMIFDGFDEMAVKVDADTLESNLLEIEKLAASKYSKVLLTSRPEYFISLREEQEAVAPTVNPFLTRETKYEPLKILPWNEEQVELFLQRRVPLVKGATQPWGYYRDQIREIGVLSDLSQRPVLLDMIVKTLPRLIASGEAINLPNLYKNYLIGEMKRQKVLKKRTFLLSDDDRLKLLQVLAIGIYSDKTTSITFADAQRRIERDLNPPKHELEAHTRDFLTNSFLIRRGDEYHLSHKSILEYLVAVTLSEEIKADNPIAFGSCRLDWSVIKFMYEIGAEPLTLLRWIEMTRNAAHGKGIYLGGNAATLLNRISRDFLAGRDLSGTNLTGAQLNDADLRGCNLSNTVLANAYLRSAKFLKKDISSAKFDRVTLSLYVLPPPIALSRNRHHVHEMLDWLVAKVRASEDLISLEVQGIMGVSSVGEDLLWEYLISISNVSDFELLSNNLSAILGTQAALSFDEAEHLVRVAKSRIGNKRTASNKSSKRKR